MRIIEKAAHWAFATFMAVVTYFVFIFLSALLIVKLNGLQLGAQLPADAPLPGGVTGMKILLGITLFLPLAAATFVGAMTAPFAQRGIAAGVFPVLMFAGIVWMTSYGSNHHGLDFTTLAEYAASCAVPGGFVYYRWRRQQSRLAGT